MLAQTLSASLLGVEGLPVRVEVDVAFGLPSLTIVGLAGSQVQEARERVRSALRNSGFELPSRRITVNLAPADVPKDGTAYDVAIAVGILAASGQLPDPSRLASTALLGELALDGTVRPVNGVLSLVAAAQSAGIASVIVAAGDEAEAACVAGIAVLPAQRLGEAVGHLAGVRELQTAEATPMPPWQPPNGVPDLGDLIGQASARRALEIAVAGRHNLAVCGPPGVGKTCSCAAPKDCSRRWRTRGDRGQPHLLGRGPDRSTPAADQAATLSRAAPHRLDPGAGWWRPAGAAGEASLAHRGILFLDEALEFRTDALDALRQPLEAGAVTIARVEGACCCRLASPC